MSGVLQLRETLAIMAGVMLGMLLGRLEVEVEPRTYDVRPIRCTIVSLSAAEVGVDHTRE
jgi:hypothetical protein